MNTRAIELMKLAAAMIEDHCPDATADYDGTTCDGYCLAEDLRVEAEQLGNNGGYQNEVQ